MRPRSRAAAVAPVLALAAAAAVAACGSVGPTPGALTPSPASVPPSSLAPSAPSASIGAPSTAPSGAAASGLAVSADPTLLELIRATDAGMTLTYDPETTATVIGDPAVARDAAAMATGLATPTGQAAPEEFVIVNAVRLRDPSVGESWFRTWRDTYDVAACRQAGGVQGHVESEIGGRTVYIGSCTNGVYTYHARVKDGSVVLSLTSIGPSRLGERLLAHVAP